MPGFGTPQFEAGSMIRFTYRSQHSEDPYKDVFVLHPNWQGKMHGIDLKRLTPAEKKVVEAIMDPDYQSGKKQHAYPLVNDILRRMNPIEDIKNPMTFYQRFVKVFIRNKDVYRTYYPARMSSIQLIKKSTVEGHVFNPRPLFHK